MDALLVLLGGVIAIVSSVVTTALQHHFTRSRELEAERRQFQRETLREIPLVAERLMVASIEQAQELAKGEDDGSLDVQRARIVGEPSYAMTRLRWAVDDQELADTIGAFHNACSLYSMPKSARKYQKDIPRQHESLSEMGQLQREIVRRAAELHRRLR